MYDERPTARSPASRRRRRSRSGRPATPPARRSAMIALPTPAVCPFLRAIDEDGALGLPVETPDPANRCAALPEPVPQSLRQQELVCLASGHVNCPRYLRGAIGTDRAAATPAADPGR